MKWLNPYAWLGALLIVPFQAAAEEFAFRALPMQVFGAWLRNPFWGILLPLPLFVVAHDYNAAGLLGVAAFALAAGVLVWRTGGIEAAIGLDRRRYGHRYLRNRLRRKHLAR